MKLLRLNESLYTVPSFMWVLRCRRKDVLNFASVGKTPECDIISNEPVLLSAQYLDVAMFSCIMLYVLTVIFRLHIRTLACNHSNETYCVVRLSGST